MNLLIGGLIGLIGLILYEQSQKAATMPASASGSSPANAAAPSAAAGQVPASVSTPISTAPSEPVTGLPQFDSSQNGSIIDLSQSPSWNGSAWTCANGSIPYYDPNAGTVYCVLPGMQPQSNDMLSLSGTYDPFATAVL